VCGVKPYVARGKDIRPLKPGISRNIIWKSSSYLTGNTEYSLSFIHSFMYLFTIDPLRSYTSVDVVTVITM
jgi:hypothetical protein